MMMACPSPTSASSGRRTPQSPASSRLCGIRPIRPRSRRTAAHSSSVDYSQTPQLATELNAVDRFLISAVRRLVEIDFLWLPLASLARRQIFSIAEERGLRVDEYAEELKKAGVEKMLDEVRDASLKYPDYYLSKFHGYADGNFSWQAAFEAKYAWMSVAYQAAYRREDFDHNMTIQEVSERWGCDCVAMLHQFCEDSGASLPKTILDVGCSTGYSSRQLREIFPDMSITGIDASPYFLAVAETEERLRGAEGADRVQYRHAVFEAMEQPENSVDMVYFQFMMHEVPSATMEAALVKAAQVVRPGGIVAFADMNPRSVALSKLPPAIKALRAASEPWLHEYETVDVEAMFERVGLQEVAKYDMDERHLGYFARVPL